MIPTNDRFFDVWTIVHFGTGLVLGAGKVSRAKSYGLIIGFELLENLILTKAAAKFFDEQELMANVWSDVAFGIGGYEAGNYLRKH